MKQAEAPKTLAIEGKVINIENIGSKTKAQFAAQLKANGIVLEEDRLQSVYTFLQNMVEKAAEAAEKAAQAAENAAEPTQVESINTEE